MSQIPNKPLLIVSGFSIVPAVVCIILFIIFRVSLTQEYAVAIFGWSMFLGGILLFIYICLGDLTRGLPVAFDISFIAGYLALVALAFTYMYSSLGE